MRNLRRCQLRFPLMKLKICRSKNLLRRLLRSQKRLFQKSKLTKTQLKFKNRLHNKSKLLSLSLSLRQSKFWSLNLSKSQKKRSWRRKLSLKKRQRLTSLSPTTLLSRNSLTIPCRRLSRSLSRKAKNYVNPTAPKKTPNLLSLRNPTTTLLP